jgi:hypothetical protein
MISRWLALIGSSERCRAPQDQRSDRTTKDCNDRASIRIGAISTVLVVILLMELEEERAHKGRQSGICSKSGLMAACFAARSRSVTAPG